MICLLEIIILYRVKLEKKIRETIEIHRFDVMREMIKITLYRLVIFKSSKNGDKKTREHEPFKNGTI